MKENLLILILLGTAIGAFAGIMYYQATSPGLLSGNCSITGSDYGVVQIVSCSPITFRPPGALTPGGCMIVASGIGTPANQWACQFVPPGCTTTSNGFTCPLPVTPETTLSILTQVVPFIIAGIGATVGFATVAFGKLLTRERKR